MRRIYFIVNPAARNGHCLKTWHMVEKKLMERGIHYFAFFTEHAGHARELAGEIARKQTGESTIIVAVGGDGTVHEVINGIHHYPDVSFGFIPGGSGNDFSRGFRIPSDPIKALEVLEKLMEKEGMLIDVGKISFENKEQRYFINNMGAGFDALISYEVNHSKAKAILNKLSLGRLVYAYFLLKKVAVYKRCDITLTIDGEKRLFDDAWFITVSNQPFYGGGMKIAPEALMDDGLFDITAVHRLSRLKLLFVFISVFWGKHIHFKEVKTFKGKSVLINSSDPIHVHADGENIGYTPLSIQLQHHALHVLARKAAHPDDYTKERDVNECQ